MLYLHSDILTYGAGCETCKGAVFQWLVVAALASFDHPSGQRNGGEMPVCLHEVWMMQS